MRQARRVIFRTSGDRARTATDPVHRRFWGATTPAMRLWLAITAFAVCLTLPTGLVHDDYLRTVLWGGALLASTVGWGAIVARALYGADAQLGWGLEAALGLAVHLALGGLLAALSWVSVTTSYVAVTLGVAMFARTAWQRRNQTGPAGAGIGGAAVVMLLIGLALLHYLGAAAERPAQMIDDFQAYFSFPKQLLTTGTLVEPFSLRRLFAYGGQSYLQALVLGFSTVSRVGVFDNGICVLVLIGLVIGWVGERPRLPLAVAVPALLGLFTLHYDGLNHNAASAFSGAVFFLAMFRVLDRPPRPGEHPWGSALALALLVSAACTLRQTYLAPAAMIALAYYGLRLARRDEDRRRWAREAVLTTLFTLTLLMPWMVLAYRSCGTPLYPLILGNGAEKYVSLTPISQEEKVEFLIATIRHPGRLPGLLMAFLAGIVVPCRTSLALRATLVGTAVASIMIINTLAATGLLDATDRYLFPSGLGYLLAVLLVATGAVTSNSPRTRRSMIAMTLVVGALVLQIAQSSATLTQSYGADTDATRSGLVNIPRHQRHAERNPDNDVYGDLQSSVPERATILAMLDQPFRLDFHRNRILTWDAPGAASPLPHLPDGQGPDVLARYLLDEGVRYVAFCDGPSPETISVATGEAMMSLGHGVSYIAYCDLGPSPAYPPTQNKVVIDLVKLIAMRKQLYAKNGIHVLDLAAPAPP